jgi:hypothetical protein
MIASNPVDGDVRDSCNYYVSSIDASSDCQLAKVVEPVESGTIEALVNFEQRSKLRIIPNFFLLILLILSDNLIFFSSDPLLKVVDVGRVMEHAQLLARGLFTLKHVEMLIEPVALDETVRHFDPPSFHGVFLAKVIVCNGIIVQVGHFSHFFKL